MKNRLPFKLALLAFSVWLGGLCVIVGFKSSAYAAGNCGISPDPFCADKDCDEVEHPAVPQVGTPEIPGHWVQRPHLGSGLGNPPLVPFWIDTVPASPDYQPAQEAYTTPGTAYTNVDEGFVGGGGEDYEPGTSFCALERGGIHCNDDADEIGTSVGAVCPDDDDE